MHLLQILQAALLMVKNVAELIGNGYNQFLNCRGVQQKKYEEPNPSGVFFWNEVGTLFAQVLQISSLLWELKYFVLYASIGKL